MAYRNDIDALAAREETLARELAAKQRERDEVKRMLHEARIADAAEARRNQVLLGRRRRNATFFGAGGFIVAGVAASVLFVCIASSAPPYERPAAEVVIARDEVRFGLALGAKGLTPVALEPRFVAAGYDSVAALDVELANEPITPWQQFLYSRDAQVRQAIASEPYRLGGVEPSAEFVSDGFGGVWRVAPVTAQVARTSTGRWTRRVWLLPIGSVFRGDVEITYAR